MIFFSHFIDLSDTWTPEQRERFLYDWQINEPLLQVGCGQKRFCDEMNDGATDEVSDNYFTVTNVKQVKIKQFRIEYEIVLFLERNIVARILFCLHKLTYS
jgi:hypothetical protein